MNSSLYAIVSTLLSFFVLMMYYYCYQPNFVMVESDNSTVDTTIDSTTIVTTQTMIFSLRLSIVYALLFSSIIGLFVLCISSISNKYKKNTEMDHLAQELKDIDRSYVSSSDFSLEDKD
jgi:hypothetical protein